MKKEQKIVETVKHGFLFTILIINLFPFALMIINSLKTRRDMNVNPMGLPSEIRWDNYPTVWVQGAYGRAFLNTVVIMAITILVVMVACGCCAYAMAKLQPRGGIAVFNYFMFTMSVSVSLCLVPLFFMWMRLNLMNTHLGLTLIYIGINIPFTVIIMRSFFIGVPGEILESARIDGCNELSVLWHIAFPIAKPIFFTASLLTALSVWNEFFYANSFIQTNSLRTVATRYLTFTGQYSSDWSKISAGGVITVLPMVVLYLVFQKQFVEGLTAGSLKG